MGHERERDGIGPNMAAEAPSQQLLRVLPGGAANSARELLASGVCPRCVLRVHGVFSSQYYAWPDEVAAAATALPARARPLAHAATRAQTLHAALSEACGSPTPSISDGDYRVRLRARGPCLTLAAQLLARCALACCRASTRCLRAWPRR
jgi:hypothetical protein